MTVEIILQSGDTVNLDTNDIDDVTEQIQRNAQLTLRDENGKQTTIFSPHIQAVREIAEAEESQ